MKRNARSIGDDLMISQFAQLARTHLRGSVDRLLQGFINESGVISKRRRRRAVDESDLVRIYDRLRNVAQALMIWHSSDDYLGPDGAPRPLTRLGSQSLTSLARVVTQRPNAARQIKTDLERLGLIEKGQRGYLPARRSAVVGLPNSLSLVYATSAISRLVGTITHNYSRAAMPRFERQVADVNIRTADLPLFLRFVEQQGQYLIDAVDDWLSTRQTNSTRGGRKVPVGIGAFAWVGEIVRVPRVNSARARGVAPRR
jgi:hypothetical protein